MSVPSSFSADFHPRLAGQWYAKECADGCDFDQVRSQLLVKQNSLLHDGLHVL